MVYSLTLTLFEFLLNLLLSFVMYGSDWIVLFEGAFVDEHGLNCYGIYIDTICEELNFGMLFFDVSLDE